MRENMSKKLTTQEFINKAQEIHGDRYDYSKSIYTNNASKIIIICKAHGFFRQSPNDHLKGKGCLLCSGCKKLTTQEFIKKAREVHGNKYDYSKSIYTGNKNKINIICPHHGCFLQISSGHIIRKQGCPFCAGLKRLTTQEFIKKATNIHGDLYNYNAVVYINNRCKITIKCRLHGNFFQAPSDHLSGRGCPECGLEKRSKTMSENPTGWTYNNWEKAADKSKSFDSFKVYLIKCSNNSEVFYKIGKTYRKINKRFKSSRMPYNFKVLETITGDAYQISELEYIIQKENKKYKYNPNLKFSGMHECFSNPPQKPLLEYQKQLLQIN